MLGLELVDLGRGRGERLLEPRGRGVHALELLAVLAQPLLGAGELLGCLANRFALGAQAADVLLLGL
ncbi:hypothetical protein [Pseudomonas aeruginosa]|uniref:hypothetical protein n=1 Tax=Pseudomonas aeruginosa TaxID=287 RepID=UPI001EF5D2BD|nr:hypothetical protein [Pseudomonas aeruginosa]